MDIYEDLSNYLFDLGYRVIIFDLYGKGGSDSPDLPNDLGLFTSQINDFIIALNNEIGDCKLILCGVSMGGAIVSHYVTLFPEKISKIILLAPFGVKVKPLIIQHLLRIPILKNIISCFAGLFLKCGLKYV